MAVRLSQAIGHEVLRRLQALGQFPDGPITRCQLTKQPPSQRVLDQLDEPRRTLEVAPGA